MNIKKKKEEKDFAVSGYVSSCKHCSVNKKIKIKYLIKYAIQVFHHQVLYSPCQGLKMSLELTALAF